MVDEYSDNNDDFISSKTINAMKMILDEGWILRWIVLCMNYTNNSIVLVLDRRAFAMNSFIEYPTASPIEMISRQDDQQ